jgi:DNA polymerase-3 subunit epsilon
MADPASRAIDEVARSMRGALGSLRAAAETLEKYPGLEAAPRARLMGVVAEEAARLGELIRRLEAVGQTTVASEGDGGAEPPTTVAELTEGIEREAETVGIAVSSTRVTDAALGATPLDLRGSQAIAVTAAFLARLRREMAVTRARLAVDRVDRHLLLDLEWSPEPDDLARLLDWQAEALDAPAAASQPGLRQLARDHDGEAWFVVDREGSSAHVKLMLPLAARPEGAGL